ncbi:MAG: aminoacyl-tRNA hydrolase [Ignavibacteria bacterium]|jgi:PTH1 family peptidyl-tRNA hydrolase
MSHWLIVGLGNPGERYHSTRHNIGRMIAEAFVETKRLQFKKGRGNWLEAECVVKGEKVSIMLPETYMNNSGQAVGEFIRYYKIPSEHVIMLVDEYNFPVGKMQLKQGGSDGGHNGTTSMIAHIGPAFWRFRFGIDKQFGPGEMADYVLAPFRQDEIDLKNKMIERGVKALNLFLAGNPSRALQQINAEKDL